MIEHKGTCSHAKISWIVWTGSLETLSLRFTYGSMISGFLNHTSLWLGVKTHSQNLSTISPSKSVCWYKICCVINEGTITLIHHCPSYVEHSAEAAERDPKKKSRSCTHKWISEEDLPLSWQSCMSAEL